MFNAFNTLSVVIIILALLFLLNKSSIGNVANLKSSKYINILEKTYLSKDSVLMVLKLGDEGVVVLQSGGNTKVLKSLTKDDISSIESIREVKKEEGLDLKSLKVLFNNLKLFKK